MTCTIDVVRIAAGLCLAVASVHGVAAEGAVALLAQAREAVGGNAWRQVATQHTQFVRAPTSTTTRPAAATSISPAAATRNASPRRRWRA